MTKMPRKRKVLTVVREVESENDEHNGEVSDIHNSSLQHGPMYTIMSNAQLNETFHNKYIKEMQQLFEKMDHDAFMYTFIKMTKSAMEAEETNEYATITLTFCAKYVCSYNIPETHPVLVSIFNWLLSTISNNPHIRYRICQFVNMILTALGVEAALDDCICDNIMEYMINRLKDLNPNVRVQAILALQRLQIPDNPDDTVVKTYQFHLSCDPSPKVRQAVITSMGRNYNTIPYILERLWDIDEKVRRHTYLHMSSYPARSYKVVQRLTFLEQGLSDRSEMVRKVVTSVMLPQWFVSYNEDYIALISALKIDANEAELDRFRKITKVAVREIFKRQKIEDIIKNVPIENDGNFVKCIPITDLSTENTLFWLCLIEYLQSEMADEIDLIIPELSVFCEYILKYCESSEPHMDKWKKMEYQYILLTLMEIINTFDLGDEIGRENLKQLLGNLLKNYNTDEQTIEVIVKCSENLIIEQEERLQFFVDIIKEISDSKTWRPNDISNLLLEELLEKQPDKNLKLKLSTLKVKILDLEEQEMNFVKQKDYVQAQKYADERNACSEQFANLIRPLLNHSSETDDTRRSLSMSFQQAKKITSETIIKCLQIAFYMVVSKKVKSLTPNVCELYKDFIRRHVESNQLGIREWALKCGTAYSMLYDQLSKDVYVELYCQFYKNHNLRIWRTTIDCIFELLDRYGFSHFEVEDKQNKSRKPGRQLLKSLDFMDAEEETSASSACGVDLMFMMSQFLDTCVDVCIRSALVNGFCRLILHGHIKNDDIVEKLLLKYFNPATEPEINQILGVFFDNLINKKKQEYFQPSLLPTIHTILSAPYDSPLHEIKPETVLRFVIDATRPIFCSSGLNIHNTMALSFMQEMQNNNANKDLLRILSKELITLEITVTDDVPLRNDLKTCCEKLLESDLDVKTAKNIKDFKDVLEGNMQANLRMNPADASDEEHEGSDDENTNTNKTLAEAEVQEQAKTNDQENQKSNENGEEEDKDNSQEEKESVEQQHIEQEENCDSEKEMSTQEQEVAGSSDSNTQTLSDNVFTSNETTDKENIIKTPTTFGRDNTTSMRYLRKSLNAQRASTEDGPSMPPKIRIQARSSSKRFDQNNKEAQDKNDEKENSRHNSTRKEKTVETSKKKGRKEKGRDSQEGNYSIRQNKKSIKEKEIEQRHRSNESKGESSEIEELPPSPEIATAKARRNLARTNKEKNIQRAEKISKTVEKISKQNDDANTGLKPRRRLRLSISPQRHSAVSETRPEKITEREKNETIPTKPKENKKDLIKTKQNKQTKTILTNSVEKKITKSKNPVLKIHRYETSPRITRSASKKDAHLNQIMTRKRLSLDKDVIDLTLSTSPTKSNRAKSTYNQENFNKSVQKDNADIGDSQSTIEIKNKRDSTGKKSTPKQNKENEHFQQSTKKKSNAKTKSSSSVTLNKIESQQLPVSSKASESKRRSGSNSKLPDKKSTEGSPSKIRVLRKK